MTLCLVSQYTLTRLTERARTHTQTRVLSRYSNSLRAGRSGVRRSVGMRFSLPVQSSPVAQPASCTIGTGSFSPRVKREGSGVNHPPLSSAKIKERVELYLCSPCLAYMGALLCGTELWACRGCSWLHETWYCLLGQTVQQVTVSHPERPQSSAVPPLWEPQMSHDYGNCTDRGQQ
jgi:hypothetical protein